MSRTMDPSQPQKFLLIDDHEVVLSGILAGLQQLYPNAQLTTAVSVESAEVLISQQPPNLIILDLILPQRSQETATAQAGIELLERLLTSALAPSIMVLSINIKPLIRLKSVINAYQGGFVALDKSTPLQAILSSADIALRGSIYLPPEVRSRPEFDQRWLRVLTLKYQQGLSDRAIAQEMGISDRTVRNYWTRIQDALNIYDDQSQDLKIQIQKAAQKAGLI
ncbi:MAG: response regulator transcription factor [Cyanobacteria bacterium J06649_4]